jgi:ectoine hydroxylase-related dioxygenase (phytanoyl-CoA dioxygenase family)
MSALVKISAEVAGKETIDALRQDGAVVLTGLFDPQEMQEQLCGYYAAAKRSKGFFYGDKTKRFSALMGKSRLIEKLCTHPSLLRIANEILGANCDSIQLNLTQAIEICPGEKAQFLHRDDELFPFENSFVTMINVMLAVTDFTIENGATRLVRGSHLWCRDRVPEAAEIEYAEMKAGSALIYLGNLLHAGSENRSQAGRRGAVIGYNLGWLRQTENFMLSVPWEAAKTFSPELKGLMGYKIHKPNVGWVEGVEPLKWIEMGRPQLAPAEDALTLEQNQLAQMATANPSDFAAFIQ